jgi:hypothetical protein
VSVENFADMDRVLVGFDRAVAHLGPVPDPRGKECGRRLCFAAF